MSQEPIPPLDPVYKSSLRELKWILVIWLVHFLWVVGYCSAFGYMPRRYTLTFSGYITTVIGMPSWVFWGVFVPWISASLVTTWFALTQIEDHDLPDSASTAVADGSNAQTLGAEHE
ncbi:MAG: hypothetical protein ACR2N1_00825 [Rubripirellula sp.]